jgi:hypothetical protein
MAVRSAMHRAGAAALSELLQFPAPTAAQRSIPWNCGRQVTPWPKVMIGSPGMTFGENCLAAWALPLAEPKTWATPVGVYSTPKPPRTTVLGVI